MSTATLTPTTTIATVPGAMSHATENVAHKAPIDLLTIPMPYASIITREYTVSEFKGGEDDGYVININVAPCYGRGVEVARPRTLSMMAFARVNPIAKRRI